MEVKNYPTLFLTQHPDWKENEDWESLKIAYDAILDRNINIHFNEFIQKFIQMKTNRLL